MKKNSIYIFLGVLFAVFMLTVSSYAETYSIKKMTPEVQNALDSRRSRYDKLLQMKNKGFIGENNRGYVQVLKDNPEVAYLVQDENSDRLTIYQTIARQNDLMDAIYTIEQVFAQVQRDKADSGHKIQNEAGEWLTK